MISMSKLSGSATYIIIVKCRGTLYTTGVVIADSEYTHFHKGILSREEFELWRSHEGCFAKQALEESTLRRWLLIQRGRPHEGASVKAKLRCMCTESHHEWLDSVFVFVMY